MLRNPIQALAEICATLHTADGRVNVPGFYDEWSSAAPWEREELAKLGGDERGYPEFLGIDAFYTPPGIHPRSRRSASCRPSSSTASAAATRARGARRSSPASAFVEDQLPAGARTSGRTRSSRLVIAAIRARTPRGVKLEFIDQHQGFPYGVVPPGRPNTPAGQSPVLARAFRATDEVVTRVWGRPPLYLREGGSVPIIAEIKRATGLDSVMFGLSLPEDNLHAPNESFNLDVMRRGIETTQQILAKVASG